LAPDAVSWEVTGAWRLSIALLRAGRLRRVAGRLDSWFLSTTITRFVAV
jgi:hypothetical protein